VSSQATPSTPSTTSNYLLRGPTYVRYDIKLKIELKKVKKATMTTNDLLATVQAKVQEQQACSDSDDKEAKTRAKDATKDALHNLFHAVSESRKEDMPEQTRKEVDAALVADAEPLKWPLLHALKNCSLHRAFLGLPQTMEQTRRFLTTVSTNKITELLSDGLCKDILTCNNAQTLQWVKQVLEFMSGADRFKKDLAGFELQGPNKQKLKAAMNQVKKLEKAAAAQQTKAQPSSVGANKTSSGDFADRDIRLVEREREAVRASGMAFMVDQALSSSSGRTGPR
jgi:hypothetical protein